MSNEEMSRHDHVLAGLVFSLQAAAMQQLGKIQNPATGEASVDLEQARATIDVLEMLKAKCRTDTPAGLLRIIDAAVMDLQLNYMDELKKSRPKDDATAADDTADDGADDGVEPAADAPADAAADPETPPTDSAGA